MKSEFHCIVMVFGLFMVSSGSFVVLGVSLAAHLELVGNIRSTPNVHRCGLCCFLHYGVVGLVCDF